MMGLMYACCTEQPYKAVVAGAGAAVVDVNGV